MQTLSRNIFIGGKLIEKICAENNITWTPLNYTKQPPVFSTLYDIYRLRKLVKQKIENNNIKIIHCRSYITALIGLWAKRKYGTKFIFDMRGFWADERIDGKIWNIKTGLVQVSSFGDLMFAEQCISKLNHIIGSLIRMQGHGP